MIDVSVLCGENEWAHVASTSWFASCKAVQDKYAYVTGWPAKGVRAVVRFCTPKFTAYPDYPNDSNVAFTPHIYTVR